jgi:hypothetical protein
MARGNKYKCLACGEEFSYCPKCAITKPTYNFENFCSEAHAKIFTILSKHGCHVTTAEETLEALKSYDTTGLTEEIQAHINSLLPPKKAKAKKEVEETPTQE